MFHEDTVSAPKYLLRQRRRVLPATELRAYDERTIDWLGHIYFGGLACACIGPSISSRRNFTLIFYYTYA
jgi:hypothetical protein